MAKTSHHIVPNAQRGGWDIKKAGADRSSGHFNTKQEAVDAGKSATTKALSLSSTVKTAGSSAKIAMGMIRIRPEDDQNRARLLGLVKRPGSRVWLLVLRGKPSSWQWDTRPRLAQVACLQDVVSLLYPG